MKWVSATLNVITRGTYLDDLLIGHTREEDMLFVLVRMELDDVGYLAVAEPLQTLASFGIPELDLTIVATRQELGSVIVEAQVFDRFDVAMECAKTSTMCVHIPELNGIERKDYSSQGASYLYFCVHTATEQQMIRLWEQSYDGHTLCVTSPSVNADLRDEALL